MNIYKWLKKNFCFDKRYLFFIFNFRNRCLCYIFKRDDEQQCDCDI